MESNEKNEIEDEDLFCPITLQLFRDPVIAADGHVYEREAIIQWINEHGTSPFTRQTLNINELQSDDYLRNLITLRRTSSVSNKYDRNNNSQLSCQQQLSVIPYNYNRSLNQTYSMQLPTIRNSNIISTGITQNRFPVGNQFCQQICLFLFLALIILFFFILICHLYISNQNHIYPQLSSIPTPSYPVILLPIYSGDFDWDSVSYRPFDSSTRLQYFYEAIRVNVFTSGHYKFWSNDMFTGYGYMYNNSFDPTIPKRNLLLWNGGAYLPFNLTIFLSPKIDYFLVVSSRDSMMMKWFSVLCSGPGNITLTTAIHLPTETSKEDENITMCQSAWICRQEQWQCFTGQCIDIDWVLDGEWDCSDASDEENMFPIHLNIFHDDYLQRESFGFKEKFRTRYTRQPFGNICNLTIEYPCLPINISEYSNNVRPCIELKSIGNGHIDCIGGYDERNVIEHCVRSGTALGYDFKCVSSNTCIPYANICKDRCLHSEDEYMCDRQQFRDVTY
ncbi:hypothetical protein I4U23_004696 [Adineta vaga]|nr:hypothetical protein I4U23_004696 [Adineta vaga]